MFKEINGQTMLTGPVQGHHDKMACTKQTLREAQNTEQ